MDATNDGGIVLGLFLMVTAIWGAMVSSVAYYHTHAPFAFPEESSARVLRLLSGTSNIGNGVVHVMLVVYMLANADNQSEYWIEERKLGGIEGPVGLAVLNIAAGYCAIQGYGMGFPTVWNSFVAVTGTMMPIVWLRFFEVGLSSWPYPVVFIWFAIFAMELTAFTASVTHFNAVPRKKTD